MLPALLYFLGSVSAAYFVALAVWPLLAARRQWNVAGAILAVAAIGACPLLIPRELVVARALACLACVDMLFRVADFARQLRSNPEHISWRQFVRFLIPFPFLLVVFGQKQLAASSNSVQIVELGRMLLGAAAFVTGLVVMLACTHVAVLRESFWLDHFVKFVVFAVGIEGISQGMAAFERLAGFQTRPIIDQPYLARTPAEFWFRYNNRVRRWLYLNVFVPSGGRRVPLLGIAAVFFVSAAFHEYFFAIATSSWDGYQFAFFMLQTPAVMISPQLARLAAGSVTGQMIARSLTVIWIAATSPLFFHGLDRVFPFVYVSQPWLP